MACAAPSPKETTNYARLCRLLVDIRDTFNNIISPATLQATLAANNNKLQSLKARRIISPLQWSKLFPAISSSVSSISFDITLLIILLRNLCGLAAPASGWDVLPAATDVSLEDDIARVKYYRNTVFAHAVRASVDDATFNRYWSEIRDTLVRLGGVPYQAAVDNLEKECMDPDVEQYYKDLLYQWKKDDDNIKDELKEISSDIKILTKKIDDLVESTLTSKKETIAEGENLNMKKLPDIPLVCREKNHDNELLKLFCKQCKVCICEKCGQTRHSHHTKVNIDQAAKERKVEIAEITSEMTKQIIDFQTHVQRSKKRMRETEQEIAETRKKALSSLEELMRVLKDYETRTMTRLDVIHETDLRGCATQLEHFQTSINQLQTSVKNCEDILRRNQSIEILHVHQNLMERCRGLLHAEKLNLNKPLYTASHTRYEINEGLVESVRHTVPGRVVVSQTDPTQSVAEGKGLEEAEVGSEARFVITAKDSNGKPSYEENDQIIVKVQTPSAEGLKGNITCYKDGTYNFTYTPDCVGQHSIDIEINGQPLADSPWRVQVRYKYLMSFLEAQGQFGNPLDNSVNERTGNIAVADSFC